MPVSKQQQTVHQETKKSVWADYQNLLTKDEHKELKTWLDICKEKIDQAVDFAVCFESKSTEVWDAHYI